MYARGKNEIWVNLYMSSQSTVEIGGHSVEVRQETHYPWDGRVKLRISTKQPTRFALKVRIPGWCSHCTLSINGKRIHPGKITRKGYACIERAWHDQDEVELNFDMPVQRIAANPRVRQTCGRIALQRGPLVYCIEEVDNGKGLNNIVLPPAAKFRVRTERNLLGGTVTITTHARRLTSTGWSQDLYRPAPKPAWERISLKAIPYCLWANRHYGEMLVWIRQ